MNKSGLYVRTVMFGIIDSLVSTVGLLAGIDVSGAPHTTLALTGLVYAFVEAFSMAVGNFLSETSAEEYTTRSNVLGRLPLWSGIVMFIAFVLAAFIPLAPYLFFSDPYSLPLSVVASIVALFVAGAVGASLSHLPVLWRGVRMALVGGAAIVVGVFVGLVVKVG